MKRLPRRRVFSRRGSVCGSADIASLSWGDWHTDTSRMDSVGGCVYIHARRLCDDTWHRVFPRNIQGHECKRLALVSGIPHWLYDPLKPVETP
jgi:hypothetical protein